ncbi:MAG: alanyl-tRNA editing protein [Acidobacteriota bacterium]|nr:MAG: alanyl-tRNA editing protein [Acidobacteriota bacterium]
MGSAPSFQRDSYLRELQTEVVRTSQSASGLFVVLADTILYPEGGGQPADRGRIADAEVVDVQKVEGEIRHFVRGDAPSGPVLVTLDWQRRFDHMQQHTGQHLLTAVAAECFGWPTTAFRLGEHVCDIELDVDSLSAGDLAKLETAVHVEIRAARPVTARHLSREEYRYADVRSRGLPEDHVGDVRLVVIEELDISTCGGTHVSSTAEVESLKLLDTEPMRGGTRLYFVAGERVRRRLALHEQRAAALRQLVGAADDEMVAVISAKLEQIKSLTREQKTLRSALANSAAEALAARRENLVTQHFTATDGGFLQVVARALLARAPEKLALLTAGDPQGGVWFLLASGEARSDDVQQLGSCVAELIGGRGGGSGRLFHGKARALQNRARAMELLGRSPG